MIIYDHICMLWPCMALLTALANGMAVINSIAMAKVATMATVKRSCKCSPSCCQRNGHIMAYAHDQLYDPIDHIWPYMTIYNLGCSQGQTKTVRSGRSPWCYQADTFLDKSHALLSAIYVKTWNM